MAERELYNVLPVRRASCRLEVAFGFTARVSIQMAGGDLGRLTLHYGPSLLVQYQMLGVGV
jgi:hypothetical protein